MAKQFSSTKQQQVLKQKLSHQNIQLFKMMELNLLQFDQKVKEELDLNPALENLDNYESNIYEKSLDNIISQHSNPPDQATQSNNRTEDFYTKSTNIENSRDLENYQTSPNYNHESNTMGDEHDLYIPIEDNDSFVSNLQNQLKYITTSDSQLVIGEFILGNLDDDGYLRRSLSQIVDDLSFRQNIVVSEEDVKTVLEMIQDLDPPGVGASNLQECLLLQLQRSKYSKYSVLAIEVVKKHFDLYSKKQVEKIMKLLKISESDYELVNQEILHLNPKPTEKNLNESILGRYIIPDFVIYRDENKLELELHSYNQPNLSISNEFVEMLKKIKLEKKKSRSEREAQDYISDKINRATTFISLVKERQETMIIIMNTILDIQKKFFLTGQESDLKPMVLRNISERTNFDISTVSRISNSKYVQTEYGVYSLKFFFSEGMINDEGEEISTRTIMKKIEDIIEAEDKKNPLSDEKITAELKNYGFNIARRTTAKYRENLNIQPKHLRKFILKS